MPLSFFYSGVIVAEAFRARPDRLRRWMLLAAMVPPVGALVRRGENALQLTMLLDGADDALARIAAGLASRPRPWR